MSVAARMRAVVEDRILTVPNPFFQPAFFAGDGRRADEAVERMHDTAAWEALALMPRDVCAELSASMTRALEGGLEGVRASVNARTGIGLIENPLRLHPGVLAFATDPLILGIVERYLRRRIYLADVDMRRVPPMSMAELDERAGTQSVGNTSSHWHRDIRGRQVKVMIYLTDVGERDSNFAYFPGSHRGFQHRPAHFRVSRYSDEQAEALGAAVDCYGPAGTTLVFDTNALHRLRRKATAGVRDSVTYYYTPGQELRRLDVDRSQLAALPEPVRGIFGGSRQAGI